MGAIEQDRRFFNLLDEPWILVRNQLGETEELSVFEVFEKAHTLARLDGELPTQDVAILRFLLAIVLAVFTRVDERGSRSVLNELPEEEQRLEAIRRWKALWDAEKLPMHVVRQYLEYYQDRFWLVHPTMPFYQVADLQTRNGEYKDASQMVTDIPSRIERRYFTLRTGKSATELACSEAARWLIALQAWDYAGKKAIVIDSYGNRGSENGGGTGWLGKLGVLYLQDESLLKTILLNMVLLHQNEVLLPTGVPIWEEEPRTAIKITRQPAGYIELLTHQSRRVFLRLQEEKVVGVTVSYGDVFDKENTFIEQMSSWHQTSKPGSQYEMIPTTHKASRSLWRDLTSLLPLAQDESTGRALQVAGLINWAQMLQYNQMSKNDMYRIVSVGIEYGTMQAVINEVINDSISINASMLADLNEKWRMEVINSLKATDECIRQLGTLAQRIAVASGSDGGAAEKTTAQNYAYYSFDQVFRNWLASLDPEQDDLETKVIEWQGSVYKLITELADDLYATASSKSIVGRAGSGDRQIIPAPVAYIRFKGAIRKILSNTKGDE
ncbi:MAG: type I-E CRISPR-associated protein Cse1/CasA [Coriobacteriia bacterium]|nr:type I-E CRISPR-associated protein Cse1/CasA [Coriobacteriia bacterium]